jgi:hypothetical protein
VAKKGSAVTSPPHKVEIPFFGWSLAAHRFRRQAVAHARAPSSLLIIAASRLERRLMAAAWQKASGAGKNALPIIDLDDCSPSDVPRRCIATTGRPTPDRPKQILPLHLDWTGSAKQRPVPAEERRGEPIAAAVATKFPQMFYMPPLARRQIDVLAWIYFYNARVLPKLGFQYDAVSSRLIHELLFDCPWQGDEDALAGYLEAAGGARSISSELARLPLLETNEDLPHFQNDYDLKKGVREAATRIYDDAISFPFTQLPDLAARIFRWRALPRTAEAAGVDDASEAGGVEDCDLLAPDFWELQTAEWTAGWTAENFCRLSLEDFVADWIFQGFPLTHDQLRKECRSLQDQRILGATFESLQSGLAIQPQWVDPPAGDDPSSPHTVGSQRNRRKRRKLKGLSTLELTPRQQQAYSLCYEAGLTVRVAAIKMKCTDKNVYRLLNQALEKKTPGRSRSVRTRRMPAVDGQDIDFADSKQSDVYIDEKESDED